MLKVGIVGLPNVGKSTLFSALTKKQVDCANFPFCTIEPNVGTVEVPDERLDVLSRMANSEKTIGTAIEFVDIAGLVKGASKGEGLGNKFLANIRETDMILHVVRDFVNTDITHVDGSIDPLRDVDVIETELMLADLAMVEKRLGNIERKAINTKDKFMLKEVDALKKYQTALGAGELAITVSLTDDEREAVTELQLLTNKVILYVVNVNEEDAQDESWVSPLGADKLAIPISVQIEAEIAQLEKEEALMFMEELGMKKSGLDKTIATAYQLLKLLTFFTVGEKETRAWTVKEGATAPNAAGVIHTDFERGFIRAEVTAYTDFVELGGESAARDKGKLRIEGKDYLMQDGDICHFRFSV
jgi:GTP-binding protein YchF